VVLDEFGSFLFDLVVIQTDVSQLLIVLALDQVLQPLVPYLVHPQVHHSQVREVGGLRDDDSAIFCDEVAGEVELADVLEPILDEQVVHPLVPQVVPGQLQVHQILQKVIFDHYLNVFLFEVCIFADEGLDVLAEDEARELLEELVLLVLLEEEVEVDGEGLHVLVVVQHLLKEVVLELVEEHQGVFGQLYLLCSFKKFHCLQIYLVESDVPCCISFFAQE